jgi:hypothetical protein
MNILDSQAIFDAALARMMTDSDKHIVTPDKPKPPPEPVIHQPILVKAPSQQVTSDGAYITSLQYEMHDYGRPTYSANLGGRPIGWRHSQPECTVSMELLLLGHPNQFLAAAHAGRVVRLVFSD